MFKAMEENRSSNQVGRSSSSSSPENHLEIRRQHMSQLGTVIPNRIFIGGIDYKINEWDLRRAFGQHGAIKDVKIVVDRCGVSKGYGFVTYEAADDAERLLNDAMEVCVKDKRLSIGLAFRRQPSSGTTNSASVARPGSAKPPKSTGGRHQATSTGYSYMYHNGMAYFQCPAISPPHQHWPVAPQYHPPVYQPASYPQYQHVPDRYPWSAAQTLQPSGPVVYQPSEYLYRPADGGSAPSPLPVMDAALPENRMFPASQVRLRPANH